MDAGERAGVGVVVAGLGGVALVQELAEAGLSKDSLQRAVRRGWLRRLGLGAYTTEELWAASDRRRRHLLLALAQQRRNPDRVVTGRSAALVLGLPLPAGPPDQPELVLPRGRVPHGAIGRQGGALQRRAWLREEETMIAEGLRVTTPARTVIDCARSFAGPWALAVGDAAASAWRVDGDDVLKLIDDSMPSPGHRRARWVARQLTPLAESPLESLARAIIILAGLPPPMPQVWITTRLGGFRVDLLDRENGVVVEADGRLKYATPQDLWHEKQREDALRDAGLEVCRFIMRDHAHQQQWLTTYRHALHRAASH